MEVSGGHKRTWKRLGCNPRPYAVHRRCKLSLASAGVFLGGGGQTRKCASPGREMELGFDP